MPKLYRPAIPMRVKLIVVLRQRGMCGCGCGEPLGTIENVEFDHAPPLALRTFDPITKTFAPPANDPDRIIAKIKVHHRLKTSHPRSLKTSIGSDQHLIAKLNPDRVAHFVVNKPPLSEVAPTEEDSPTPPEDEHRGRSSQIRPRWASQKIPSRPFRKGHQPMRRKPMEAAE